MENIEAMLCGYIEGDLDEAGRAQIEKHLEKNPQHRKLLSELMQMRDMVKALPRAKAPMDLSESLHQKVERSMLLEDAEAALPTTKRVDRLPQIFAIAAMLLLVSALCFIVVRALAPTMKPAVFTQTTDKFTTPSVQDRVSASDREEMEDLATARPANAPNSAPAAAVPSAAEAGSGNRTAGQPANDAKASGQAMTMLRDIADQSAQKNLDESKGAVAQLGAQQQRMRQAEGQVALAPVAPGSVAQARVQNFQQAAIAQVDLSKIERRLKSSGYGIGQASKDGSATLVLINSTDPTATEQQVLQFFNSNNVISSAVPEESGVVSKTAANLAFGGGNFGGAMKNSPGANDGAAGNAAMQPMAMNEVAPSQPQNATGFASTTTRPSSDVYVARGLTTQQVDALRQTLTVPQKWPAVQVTVSSVPVGSSAMSSPQGQATTQPTSEAPGGASVAVQMPKDVNAMGLPGGAAAASGVASAGGATTQPVEAANTAADLASGNANGAATTMPATSDALSQQMMAANSQALQQVDAVIVLQAAPVALTKLEGAEVVAPTTQPDAARIAPHAAYLQPPSTQPSDESGAATQP